jgi:hypothetical protein
MTLDEIRSLLPFRKAPEGSYSAVNDLLDKYIGDMAQRIRELQSLQRQVKALWAIISYAC